MAARAATWPLAASSRVVRLDKRRQPLPQLGSRQQVQLAGHTYHNAALDAPLPPAEKARNPR
jgi:hypothetical protein